jgi:hypothetical protein
MYDLNGSSAPGQSGTVVLREVTVRPIRASEKARWDRLMSAHHYLGFRALPGESVRYAAEYRGEWVALLGWGGAAFKCGARDRWIGWTPEQQWRRLQFVACNLRFLILPGVETKNLASRVLSLNVKRLREDWEGFHGHTVALAETFVDPSRFKGTCYRAAGWARLGETRGFGRNAGQYFHHGCPKIVMVYPLVRDAQKMLSSPFIPPELQRGTRSIVELVDLNKVRLEGDGGLVDVLAAVKDPRKRRGVRHDQVSILAVAVCACLAGCKSLAAMAQWAGGLAQPLLKRLGCRYNFRLRRYLPPSEPTLRRTLQSVDADEVDTRVGRWLLAQSEDDGVALDGKTLRGSRSDGGKAVHLMSALLHQEGLVVSQTAVSEKSNEITAVRPLLEPIDIKGKMVTADAMHAQVDHARFIVEEKEADYFFTVKANQPGLLKDIQSLNADDFFPSIH